ncbi:hypothetical protein VPH35_135676 [Triticum aestivum]
MVEELVEKILLSILPEEPEILVRASLACKPWCRLLSGNAFRSRCLALHGTAPVLGFLQSWVAGDPERFVPTKKFCPRRAVLCSMDGCDHAACNSGPFSVACIEDEGCVDDNEHSLLRAFVYSSYTQKWTSPACIHIGFVSDNCFMGRPSLLIGKQLYFLLDHGLGILRLGVVHQDQHGLCVVYSRWSIDGEYRWLYSREIDLNMLRPIGHPMSSHPQVLAGSLEGTDVSIVVTDLGVFTFDRKFLKFKKLPTLAGVVDDQRAG